ncbi:MAG: hypothetical protein Tsb0015_10320 [Simkaniaceae bacterium]
MKKFFLVLIFLPYLIFADAKQIISSFLSENDKRYPTFLEALRLMEKRGAKVLVETGTARNGEKNFAGDGGSTIIFGKFAKQNDCVLYSVDIDPVAVKKSREACEKKEIQDRIFFKCCDSIKFLTHFGEKIDFLYLDSFDFDANNPKPSQEHHLKEVQAALPWITDNTIILIYDCLLQNGGKGKLAIAFLLRKGWKVHKKGYQVLLVKKNLVS